MIGKYLIFVLFMIMTLLILLMWYDIQNFCYSLIYSLKIIIYRLFVQELNQVRRIVLLIRGPGLSHVPHSTSQETKPVLCREIPFQIYMCVILIIHYFINVLS